MTQEQMDQIEREVGFRAGDIAEHDQSGVRGTVQWLIPSETADDLIVTSGGKFYRLCHRIDGALRATGWSMVEAFRPEHTA